MRYALKALPFREEIWSEIYDGETFMSSTGKVQQNEGIGVKSSDSKKKRKKRSRPFQASVKRRKVGERV